MKCTRSTTAFRGLAILATIAATTACGDDPVTPLGATAVKPAFAHQPISAMPSTEIIAITRNIYIGINADAVIVALANADPADDLPALLSAIETLQKTDVHARARALAREIAASRAHFVGLQEVSEIEIQIPPLGVSISLDFLAILLAELDKLGRNYEVAASIENFGVSLAPLPGSTIGVRDFDVILVDGSRVTYDPATVVSRSFAANLGVVAPGVNLVRGFVAVTAIVKGQVITVANTHLESGDALPILAQIRAAQVQELVATIGNANPAIILGDLNDVEGSLMYQVVSGAGFSDVWRELNPTADGFTCCHAADLSNFSAAGALTRRLDYIFVRGAARIRGRLLGHVELVGEVSSDRIAGPAHDIWPSDHAGVVGRVRLAAQPVDPGSVIVHNEASAAGSY